MICTFLNNLIAMGDQAVLLLYLTYTPREFTTEMYGVFNSARMLLFVSVPVQQKECQYNPFCLSL
uniref:Uncharacterized protein n=1 Tax=Anguilla anguilla TaxID=7936 RepID=A0A0E9VHV4_ANGAN